MEDLEDVAGLLFAAASVDRLTLFYTISKERLRLTQLASRLPASTQETSRHLSRLQEAKIIERRADGCFNVTPFGKSLLVLLPSLKFLTRHKEYFLSHDLSTLPSEFIERIGELEEGEFRHGVGEVLNHTAVVIREAEEYVWLCSDNPMDLTTLGGKRCGENVPFRIIVPVARTGANIPETPSAELGSNTELRLVDRVNTGIAMNEKRAGVTFPSLTGEIDFNSGFGSNDPNFHKWCADLFMFHWNKAKSV
jgi:predicted transcriptional regulator